MLTYKGHINKEMLIENLVEDLKRWEITFIRAAHESADKTDPYDHTHVLLRTKKRMDIVNERRFDWQPVDETLDVIHPNLKPVNTVSHWNNSKHYLSKEDPANSDLARIATNWIESVEMAEDDLGAIQGKAGEYFARKDLYKRQRLEKFKANVKKVKLFADWQDKLAGELFDDDGKLIKANSRSITWIYESKGNVGKTHFSKFMRQKYEKDVIVFTEFGRSADANMLILNEIVKGVDPNVIIIDLVRRFADWEGFYGILERIKNGMLTSTKYSSEAIEFDPPHLVVFANFPPHVIDEQKRPVMSLDRWDIRQLKWVQEYEKHMFFYEDVEKIKKKNMKMYTEKKNLFINKDNF